ncbi:TldD/PmbA family protein, partial [bacterium]|nr:TldD/PmbA family protein [bacterium]
MSRRKLIGLGAATLAGAALPDALFNLSTAAAAATGPTEGIGYFARFGVTEKMLRDGLSAALSRGADYADLFFQHRVSNGLGLEDGEVNRASTSVELGVGVRAVKGDQTGYAYTEDLTLEALVQAAKTAAAIADGPA